MIIKRLKIANFRSVKEADIKLDKKHYLILGKNHDDNGLDSNGSGKSNIPDSIAFCLFNRSLKKTNNFTRNGQKKCSVILYFNHNGHKYKMKNQKPGKPSLFIDGEECKKLNLFEYVKDEVLGIDFDTFKKIILLSDENRMSFCGMTDTQIKGLLDNLIDDDINNKIDKAYKNNNEYLEETNRRLIGIPQIIENNKERIEELMYKIKNESKNEEGESKINEYKKSIIVHTKEAERISKKISILSKKFKQCKLNRQKQKESVMDALLRYRGGLNKLNESIDWRDNEINELTVKISKFVTCPECGYSFAKKVNEDKERLESLLEERTKEKLELIEKKDNLVPKIKELEEELDSIVEKYDDKMENLSERNSKLSDRLNDIKSNIKSTEIKISNIKQLKKNMMKNSMEEINDLKNKNIEQEELYSKLSKKYDRIYKFWKIHLGREGLKNYLYNKKLKLIEQYTNNILLQLDVNYKVELDGFRKLKSGAWKNKVSIKIIDGKNTWNYFDRSKGEELRIDYATMFAYRNLLSNKIGTTFEFISLDELFNGFDGTGKQEICEFIKCLSDYTDIKQSFIMSHDDDVKDNFKDIINVQKRNEISKIKID